MNPYEILDKYTEGWKGAFTKAEVDYMVRWAQEGRDMSRNRIHPNNQEKEVQQCFITIGYNRLYEAFLKIQQEMEK